ncbi:hypothetical protein Tco_0867649, partial [Tanacetum coccineum]
ICRWWDLDGQNLASFSDWQAWFLSIRLPSKTKMLLEVDDDNPERSERFAEEAFGSVVVPAFVLWSFSCSVSDLLEGMVEITVCATSSIRSCGGVAAKVIVLLI